MKFMNIFKSFGMLSLLCILLSTTAFSEEKTDALINQTNITAATSISTNASENLTAPLNESKVIEAKTNVTATTSTNASENLTAPLNESKVIEAKTNVTAAISTNASENLIAPLNESKVIEAKTNVTAETSTNASENLTAPLNESNVVGSGTAISSSVSTETSSNSWDDAVQSVIRTVESTGQKVESIEVLKLNVKIGENNTII